MKTESIVACRKSPLFRNGRLDETVHPSKISAYPVLNQRSRLLIFLSLIGFGSFFVADSFAQPPRVSISKTIAGANTLLSSGLNGDTHTLLFATNVTALTNISSTIIVDTIRTDRLGTSTFVVTNSGPDGFFKVQAFDAWTPPPALTNVNGIRLLSLPEDQIAPTGGEALFVVQAEAVNTNNIIKYQWFQNEIAITNATNFDLYLTDVRTNVDVGFYSCDLQAGTNLTYRVRSRDCDAPGARLFVYFGTNTAITGPYQPSPGGLNCLAGTSYLGYVQFKNPEPGPYYGTTYFAKPPSKSGCIATDRTAGIFPYHSIVFARATGKPAPTYCPLDTAVVMNPADSPPRYLYQFTVFVTGGSAISSSDLTRKITLDVNWQ